MYYNMPAVREAMHAAPIPSEAGIFLGLNPRVQSAYTYNILSVVPQHQFLIDRGKHPTSHKLNSTGVYL